jgi:secondary thiamine-phosphate synthase enzyme
MRMQTFLEPEAAGGGMNRKELTVRTNGRGFVDLTRQVNAVVSDSGVREGLCNLFIAHTSASLIISENADPDVLRDLESFFARLAPDGDPAYRHDTEGPDDMPSHIRAVLTQSSLVIPVSEGGLSMGTWQAVYLWEHRRAPHTRGVLVSVW